MYWYQHASSDYRMFVLFVTVCAYLNTFINSRGYIFLTNETYVLQPLIGGDMHQRRHPHVIYRSTTVDTWTRCANSGIIDYRSTLVRKSQQRQTRDINNAIKYIELALLVEPYQLKQSLKELFADYLPAVNLMDMIFQQLNTRVALVHFGEAELACSSFSNSQFDWSSAATESLLTFIRYTVHELRHIRKDITLLLTEQQFANHEMGIAVSGGICSPKSAGGLSYLQSDNSVVIGLQMAHIAAHILGIKHDNENDGFICECSGNSECLMNERVTSISGEYLTQFSSCSHRDYSTFLGAGYGKCLLNKPLQLDDLQNCGNGIIDDGEQCDCGDIQECDELDPCCDPINCQLKAHAECATGPCCLNNCKLKPAGEMCRGAIQECDVPEYCDGERGTCPFDQHKADGTDCASGSSYCFLGECNSAELQCQNFWGKGASSAARQCYEKFNVLGVDVGNCGRNLNTGMLESCNISHALCGLVQCKGGADVPLLKYGGYYKTEFSLTGQQFECKVITSQHISVTDIGLVRDGTKCGDNMICRNHACLPLNALLDCSEYSQCSGHGVCTNANKCFCDHGWAGEDCSRRAKHQKLFEKWPGETTTMGLGLVTDSSMIGQIHIEQSSILRLDGYTMLMILGGVGGGVLLLLLFLSVCYRRRTISANAKKQQMSAGTIYDFEQSSILSDGTGTQRSIKFGQMPSYRDEKLRRRRQEKRDYRRNLHEINETDERNSHSSRDSAPAVKVEARLPAANRLHQFDCSKSDVSCPPLRPPIVGCGGSCKSIPAADEAAQERCRLQYSLNELDVEPVSSRMTQLQQPPQLMHFDYCQREQQLLQGDRLICGDFAQRWRPSESQMGEFGAASCKQQPRRAAAEHPSTDCCDRNLSSNDGLSNCSAAGAGDCYSVCDNLNLEGLEFGERERPDSNCRFECSQTFKLSNIEYLMKQLDSQSDCLYSSQEEEFSGPEADSCFANKPGEGEAGCETASCTESHQNSYYTYFTDRLHGYSKALSLATDSASISSNQAARAEHNNAANSL